MHLYARGSYLDLSLPKVMGILNVTPDSFYDGGKYITLTNAITYTNKMINAGAAIIDVGGESTRPGALEVSVDEELERVIPIIEAIQQRFNVWISIDTSKPEVILESARVGIHIINDTRSLSKPGALQAASKTGLPICLMHMKGKPNTMQLAPNYYNIIKEVDNYLAKQIERCKEVFIKEDNLLLDLGFGFGKNLSHNYKLLANFNHFHHFGLPLVVGVSRKSMISNLLNVNSAQSLIGSISCAVIAAMQGAHIIRAHDVKETVEAMSVVNATRMAKG